MHKVKSQSEVAQLCQTLSDLTDCTLPGSSVHGIFQARVLEWGAIAFSVQGNGGIQIQMICQVVVRVMKNYTQSNGTESGGGSLLQKE